ncbi:MAG: cysteine--tRNA ligase, partial [Huintestinicola sp.]
FSYENLDNAAGAYEKLISRIERLLSEPAADIDKTAYDELMNGFRAALDNDLNTSLSVTALYDVLKADTNASTKLALIDEFDKVLGLDLIAHAKKSAEKKNESAAEEIPAEIAELVEQRKAARKAKDFALADALRDKIGEMGYIIEETRQGTKVTKK